MVFYFKKELQTNQNQMLMILTNLYQNNGYLFSNINAVEVKTENDTIDFEIRISEGPLLILIKLQLLEMTKQMTMLFIVNFEQNQEKNTAKKI